MDASDLVFRSVAELAAMVGSGEVSPGELTEAYLARIDRHNRRTRAYITVTAERARDAAAHGEGPLRGIGYACKDLIQTRGITTTGGSKVLADWRPEADADVVERLDGAGAVMLGKANLHEFGHGATGENPHFGTAPNPYDGSRLAGGSSSGSAAAVAYGLAAFALGTDTGGSVRVPAALCGLTGLKPTLGRISTRGVIPYSWSMDHVGVLARDTADAALVLEVLAGHDPGDPASSEVPVDSYARDIDGGVRGLRIGIPRRFFFDCLDGEIAGAVDRSLALWEGLGAELTEVELPDLEHARAVSLTIQMPEALSFHGRYLADRADLYGADFRSGLALGQFLLAEHYVRAKRMVERYRRRMAEVFADVDVLATPACPLVAPAIGTVTVTMDGVEEAVGNALTRFTSLFNMTGHPALTVPCGLHSSGLPMAVQIVGRHFEEAVVLRVGRALEAGCEVPPPPRDAP